MYVLVNVLAAQENQLEFMQSLQRNARGWGAELLMELSCLQMVSPPPWVGGTGHGNNLSSGTILTTTCLLFPKEYQKVFLGGRAQHGMQWWGVSCNEKTSSGGELLRWEVLLIVNKAKKKKPHRKIMKILPNLWTDFFYSIFFILCWVYPILRLHEFQKIVMFAFNMHSFLWIL